MNFVAVFLALLLEQAKPLSSDNPVHRAMRGWATWVRLRLDAGRRSQAWGAWCMAVLGPALLSAVVYWGLLYLNVLMAWAWVVVVVYATLGFRQFSHHFTAIREALEAGDEASARQALAQWLQLDVNDVPRQEIVRHAIEYAVVAAHRHVFGVLVCFVVFSVLGLGPAGAVFYRMAEHVRRTWANPGQALVSDELRAVAVNFWCWVDVVPARVTALSFAAAGNFEEAVASWRRDASQWGAEDRSNGVLLATAAGAIGVRLGGRSLETPPPTAEGRVTDGRAPQLAHLSSTVGLVWRTVVLWMGLLALVTVASVWG